MGIIYKITNKINNKIYIGKTTQKFEARIKQHFGDAAKNSSQPLHLDMAKLNIHDFKYEIIDFGNNDYDLSQLEIKYIKECNANDPSIGYNQTLSPYRLLKMKDVHEIRKLLEKTNKTQDEIARLFNCSRGIITDINNGDAYKNSKINYPIRKHKITPTNDVEKIINLLKTSNLNFKEIGRQVNVDANVVRQINIGDRHKNNNIIYPIRKVKSIKGYEAQNLLLNSNYSKKEISKLTGLSDSYIQNINTGSKLHNENIQYPIR